MYGLEDAFEHFCGRVHIHWMWWPAIGGIGIGIGGYFFPRGLGVGYDNIAELLRGNAPVALLLGLVIAKSLMWAFSLSSGTSGGVLAPLLMIGAAIGESAAHLAHLPGQTQALWALMGMGAMLAGALGVPLTAVLFSLELTHALPAILPLVLACTASYLVTSLIMPRSILTEKLGRRGYHLSREYGVDPLELLTVAEVMTELPPGDEVIGGKTGSSAGELRLFRRDLPRCRRRDGYHGIDESAGRRPRDEPPAGKRRCSRIACRPSTRCEARVRSQHRVSVRTAEDLIAHRTDCTNGSVKRVRL